MSVLMASWKTEANKCAVCLDIAPDSKRLLDSILCLLARDATRHSQAGHLDY